MNTDFSPIINSFKTDEKVLFKKARVIRDKVFVQEQNVAEEEEFDEFEDESLHYLLTEGNKAIGTARWRHIGNKVKLERFAVLKEYRGKGYGDFLVKTVLKDALKEGKTIYLHAQLKAIPLYERSGFKKVGDLFMECDIEHYKMVIEGS
ncbi:MAG: GNAT family N-acetyltransferase [Flavobacteriales bacterium]|nr:GNAT family N-acetyltransferase [Flavobacteriales bacterium]|tara:strand:- start:212 stop:658 length:447 start_codon:yes stop_codon:yes gene_type:complete